LDALTHEVIAAAHNRGQMPTPPEWWMVESCLVRADELERMLATKEGHTHSNLLELAKLNDNLLTLFDTHVFVEIGPNDPFAAIKRRVNHNMSNARMPWRTFAQHALTPQASAKSKQALELFWASLLLIGHTHLPLAAAPSTTEDLIAAEHEIRRCRSAGWISWRTHCAPGRVAKERSGSGLLERHGYTLTELAPEIDLPAGVLYDMEQGRIGCDVFPGRLAVSLSTALRLSFDAALDLLRAMNQGAAPTARAFSTAVQASGMSPARQRYWLAETPDDEELSDIQGPDADEPTATKRD
jgi:hypothetical protein